MNVAAQVSLADVTKGVAGFVAGGLLTIFVPPLAIAMALILGGILLWSRLRGEDVGAIGWLSAGFLLAVAAYLLLAVVAAVG